jgi:hypothetical protein
MKIAAPLTVLVTLLAILAFGTSSASAATAWWHLDAIAVPANLPPGGTGTVVVSASDLGEAEVDGANVPVKLIDRLSSNLTATSAVGKAGFFGIRGPVECEVPSAHLVECTFHEGNLPSYERLEVEIAVSVGSGPVAPNEISVSGGESYSCSEVGAGSGKYANSVCSAEGGGNFELQLSGKPVAEVTATRNLVVSSAPVAFGVENYEVTAANEDGSPARQAGSHPFSLTTTFDLNRTTAGEQYQPALPKDLVFRLPPGLIGNPTPFPQCSGAAFSAEGANGTVNECPANTVVGVAAVTINFPVIGESIPVGTPFTPLIVSQPVFNLKPAAGEPARFGFLVLGKAPVILDTSVRTGGDYGVTVTVHNITQTASFYGSQVTFWGVPGDPRHDQARGWSCLGRGLLGLSGEPCAPLGEALPPPLLSLPTSCTGALQSSVLGDSWARKGSFTAPFDAPPIPGLNGCEQLPFGPSIKATPDVGSASSPSGLNVDVHVPQQSVRFSAGEAESTVRDIEVKLPEGVQINPSGGDGLQACTSATSALSAGALGSAGDEIGYTGVSEVDPGFTTTTFTGALAEPLLGGVNFCPDASKIGEVTIHTPLLPNPLKGFVYLASQNENPFGSLIAMYIEAQDPVSGTLVKLPAQVSLTPSGRVITTIADNPQLPFEDAELHFFGGERAPLATPAKCGSYTTEASFTPWSGNAPVKAESTFQITSGPNGTPCPGSSLPFTPTLTGGMTNANAGAFSPFSTTIGREDGEQNMASVTLHMPPGLSGLLSGVELCSEANANAGTCGPNSLIGETTVSAGIGSDPVSVKGGKVYITAKYHGAPFGLSIVNPVKAGPFDLEHDTSNPAQDPACDCVVVRAKIDVDPTTAALTVITNSESEGYAIPHLLDGVPVQIKKVNVLVNRPGFTFNPTSCNPMEITGSIVSDEGASSPVKVPFQVANCAILGFKPGFAVSTSGKTSRVDGASLSVKLTYPSGAFGKDANIAKVKVDLPKQLPSRLTTLQKACTEQAFDANPASCPAGSVVGRAKAITPLVPVPLEGPAYFVSHGGAKFPELIIVLQGYGITLDLHGETYINKSGITSSTFATVPDAPVGSFELTLPQGPDSALAANGDLCTSTLTMPTAFTAQNGAEIHESTPISVSGCKAAVTVVGHSVKGAHASIRVTVPSAGTLVATGGDVNRSVRRAAKAGTVTIGVTLTGHGRHVLAKNPHQRVNMKVKLLFTPKHGAPLTAYVRLLVG